MHNRPSSKSFSSEEVVASFYGTHVSALVLRSSESRAPVEDFTVRQMAAGSGLMMRLIKEVIVMATMKVMMMVTSQQMQILSR